MPRSELTEAEYAALKLKVRQRDGHRCRRCKRRNNLTVHHLIFRSSQGPDTLANLCSICADCHDLIHAYKVVILAKSGNPEDQPDANIGLQFVNK